MLVSEIHSPHEDMRVKEENTSDQWLVSDQPPFLFTVRIP